MKANGKEIKLLGMALKALMDAGQVDKVKEIIDEMADATPDKIDK